VVYKTRVLERTLNPDFNDEFRFTVSPAEMQRESLEITVYDQCHGSEDNCLGQICYSLDQLTDLRPRKRVTVSKNLIDEVN